MSRLPSIGFPLPRCADQSAEVGSVLYHATLADNLESVLERGLEARAGCRQIEHPERVYLSRELWGAAAISRQLRLIEIHEKRQSRRWKPDFAIFEVRPEGLLLPFWYDGYAVRECGVYTDRCIPPGHLRLLTLLDGEALLAKNWPRFWRWLFWQQGERPSFLRNWVAP